jgi:cellulose biosynthesis protein BcsQ
VGKTTIALGVAAALLTRGTGALLIDLDPQASATWSRAQGLEPATSWVRSRRSLLLNLACLRGFRGGGGPA